MKPNDSSKDVKSAKEVVKPKEKIKETHVKMNPKEESSEVSSTKSKEQISLKEARVNMNARDGSSEVSSTKSKENHSGLKRNKSKALTKSTGEERAEMNCRDLILYLAAAIFIIYCLAVLFFGNFV